MHEIVARRHRERDALIATARDYAESLARRLGIRSVVVSGSVARGDFNVWSDIDLVVVADELPERMLDRVELLLRHSPGGIEAFGYTPSELARQRERRNALLEDALEHGVVVYGASLAALLAESPAANRSRSQP